MPPSTASRATNRRPIYRTLESLFRRLGPIPPNRVRLSPPPGMAEEHHVLEIENREDRLCELVDGVLIEKDMASFESHLAMLIGYFLNSFLEKHDLGIILGESGMLRLALGLVRIPDVSFISWEQLPGRIFPDDAIANMYPDLAVEVISAGNSPGEMRRKLRDYFTAGTRLVWFIYPKTRSAEVYTSPRQRKKLAEADSLDGGSVLPGFELSLRTLFARAVKRRSG
ncbi:MAG TPA: Uma2 family endonuclease [Gemmataceae bacterium]|nr:Uma2 family endonuclease [Gemmataceae bacterium]